jgi:1,4-dihydroxy-2-naphthoyl-CoA hydrolase
MSENFIEQLSQGNDVHSVLGVMFVEATADKVVLQVEVGPKVHQNYGILHGGVSALLAESAASIGGAINVQPDYIVVGTELNCSHLRSMTSGVLTATATPVRKGRRVQVWSIDLTDQEGRQICVARCTLQVLEAPSTI